MFFNHILWVRFSVVRHRGFWLLIDCGHDV
uniref:Uncharacterized protein n=1 Tax=Rhizophora mucronata TaxID=61149 RepID=A0A2P2JAK1_RHIMU